MFQGDALTLDSSQAATFWKKGQKPESQAYLLTCSCGGGRAGGRTRREGTKLHTDRG